MAVDHSFRALAATVAVALGLSCALRFYLVEPQAMGALCTPAAAPWWCALRQDIILGFYHGVFAWAGVVLLAAALRALVLANRSLPTHHGSVPTP